MLQKKCNKGLVTELFCNKIFFFAIEDLLQNFSQHSSCCKNIFATKMMLQNSFFPGRGGELVISGSTHVGDTGRTARCKEGLGTSRSRRWRRCTTRQRRWLPNCNKRAVPLDAAARRVEREEDRERRRVPRLREQKP